MSKSIIAISVCAFMLAGAAALAADQNTPASPSSTGAVSPVATASSDLDRVVCREGQAPTGSLIKGDRICRTQRMWNEIRQDAQDQLVKRQTNVGCGSASAGC
jgi:hypothetical protein